MTAKQPGEQAREAAKLWTAEEATWGPAPDAFPAGVEMCVLHGDPAAAGALFTVRLKASQGYVFAPHSHPHDEHVTVISGALQLGDGGVADRSRARILRAGAYAFLPREQFHYGWAVEEDTVFQVEAIGPFAITYARPEDDPRQRPMH